MMITTLRTMTTLLAALGLPLVACAQVIEDEVPIEARGLDIVEKLDAQVPFDAMVTTLDGESVPLGDFFDGEAAPDRGRPTILLLVYYDCPVACPAMLGNLNKAFNGIDDWTIGDEYNVLAVSFDPTNTREQAEQYAMLYRSGYEQNAENKDTVARGYQFLRASADDSRAIAEAVGFGFRYLPEVDEYAHATGAVVLTPQGKVSRYFYGFDYPSRQVRLALLDAADGRVGASFGDRVLLFCFTYDPYSNSYTLAAFRVMQAGAVVMIVLVVGLIAGLKISERIGRTKVAKMATQTAARAQADQSAPTNQTGLESGAPGGRAVGVHA